VASDLHAVRYAMYGDPGNVHPQDLRNTQVRFRICDIHLPEPAQVLAEHYGQDWLLGRVIDLSDFGSEPKSFAVVEVEKLRTPVVVPVAKLVVAQGRPGREMTMSSSNWEHLRVEMAILRLYLLREVRSMAQSHKKSQKEGISGLDFQGLVLTEQEILSILTKQADEGSEDWRTEIDRQIEKLDKVSAARTQPSDSGIALRELTEMFGLERFEQQCLMLCLAVEIEPKYTKVCAFLHDDVTRKTPTLELALRLFCSGMQEQMEAQRAFLPQGPLRKYQLVQVQETSELSGPLSHRWLRLDERIAAFLQGIQDLDSSLDGWVRYERPDRKSDAAGAENFFERTARLAESRLAEGKEQPIVHLYGKFGSAKQDLAEYVCGRLSMPLLVADAQRIPVSGRGRDAWQRLVRESRLRRAAIFVENFDELIAEGRSEERNAFLDSAWALHRSPLIFLSGRSRWKGMEQTQARPVVSLECAVQDASVRIERWKQLLSQDRHNLSDADIAELGSKFEFTAAQMKGAFLSARNRALWLNQPPAVLDKGIINEACRAESAPVLGQLARLIEPVYGWEDIILPGQLMQQLREIATHVRRSHLVLEGWCFERKFPYGRGVTGLFHGESGTGKTMAVGIIAGELALGLYKVDLSTVVSKYIGETEKNLSRVFAEAQDSNAILFFDEADALFGKRSQVKDAHDRYANLEIAYLLQRIEEYSGVVILATNMKHNMDDAFVRRMRFILHFPFPSEQEREKIWRGAFPKEAPLAKDVDFAWLARKLRITGGTIKNITLRGAFLAAEGNGEISMTNLKEAAKFELEKIAKITELAKFQPAAAKAVDRNISQKEQEEMKAA
jgi:ATPase family associated with various cellular activities (AAA)